MIDKTETKTVYGYSADGKLISSITLDYTDRSPISGDWQLPAGTTEVLPLEAKNGYDLYFIEGVWQYIEQVKEEEPTKTETETVQQNYVTVDSDLLNLAQAIADQEERLTKLEGGKTA